VREGEKYTGMADGCHLVKRLNYLIPRKGLRRGRAQRMMLRPLHL